MSIVYCSYSNFDPHFEQEFDGYWQQFHQGKTNIQHIFQNEQNNYAAVFNIWIRLLHQERAIVLKPEKIVLHAYDELLINKINFYLGNQINYFFERNQRDPYIIFLYAYFLTAEVIRQVDNFCEENPMLDVSRLILYPYFYLSDFDLTEDAEIYLLMKVLIADFLHGYLTEKMTKAMHNRTVNFVHEIKKANALR